MSSKQNTHDNDARVRYLLGELDEEERIRFEEACFADDQQFEELLAVEADLTDDYVRGDLVGLRRERFAKQLLNTPEGRDEVEFARIITASPAPQAAAPVLHRRRSDWGPAFAWLHFRPFQVAFAVIALVLVGLGLWLIWSSRQQPQEAMRKGAPANIRFSESPQPPNHSAPTPGPSQGEHQAVATPERQQREPRNGNSATTHEAPAIVSLLVIPGFDRSAGGANDLIITTQTRTVRLQFAVAGDNYRSYRAVLRSVEGKEIFDRRGLKARSTNSGSTVSLELPAGAFPQGDFILTLSGATYQDELEDVNKYFLSVSKK